MRMIQGLISLLAALGVAFVLAAVSPASAQKVPRQVAQAGSTGGTIGKRSKSVSGGARKEKPAAAPATRPRKTHRKPSHAHPARPARASISGRWRIKMKCNTGLFDITATLRQDSATDFSGSSIGHNTHVRSTVTGSIRRGDNFTWVRKGLVSLRGHGHFSGNHMSGTENGPVWSCTFTGRRG